MTASKALRITAALFIFLQESKMDRKESDMYDFANFAKKIEPF
jgi:hypothetical protein